MEKKTAVIAIAVAAIVILAGAAAAYFLVRVRTDAVNYVVVAPSLMGDWLAVNESDGFIAWEPFVSSSVVDGHGRVLIWSGEVMPNHPCCVVVVSQRFLATDMGPELTKRFLKAHIEATAWILAALEDGDSEEYAMLVSIAADFTKRSPSVVEEAMAHVDFGYEMNESFEHALEQFTQMYIDDGWITAGTFQSRGYSDVTEFIDDYVDGSYLEQAMDVAPSTTLLNPDDPVRLGYLNADLHQLAQSVARNRTVLGGSESIFEKYGVNVEPLQPFANGGFVMDAFVAGEVDVGYLGAPPAILKRINLNADTVIIAQANSEGSGLVVSVDSDIQSLADLVGRTVATPGETSIQHLLLRVALEREGIKLVKG